MAPDILKWRLIDSVPHPSSRHGHRAVNIENYMLIFGGSRREFLDQLYVFNTKTSQWFIPLTKGAKPPKCAAHGFAAYGMQLFVFGGVVPYNQYSNELYELSCTTWEWRKFSPSETGLPPCPRLGHSFTTMVGKIYLFGGVTSKDFSIDSMPRYLTDLYTLDIRRRVPKWEIRLTFGKGPSPRESHTAVAYTDKVSKKAKLVIYGGMMSQRLDDLWILDIESMTWSCPDIKGVAPLPRSLHTSILIDHRMYIFGGWVPNPIEELRSQDTGQSKQMLDLQWKTSNTLACINLENMVWEDKRFDGALGSPLPRAGHCSAGIRGRLYVFSGRYGNRPISNDISFCKDFWYIDFEPPEPSSRMILVHGSFNFVNLRWSEIPTAQVYLLEVCRLDSNLTVPYLTEVPTSSTTIMSPILPVVPSMNVGLSKPNKSYSTVVCQDQSQTMNASLALRCISNIAQRNICPSTVTRDICNRSTSNIYFTQTLNGAEGNPMVVRVVKLLPQPIVNISQIPYTPVRYIPGPCMPTACMPAPCMPTPSTISGNSSHNRVEGASFIIADKSYKVQIDTSKLHSIFNNIQELPVSQPTDSTNLSNIEFPVTFNPPELANTDISINNYQPKDRVTKLGVRSIKTEISTNEKWCTVGFLTDLSCTVFDYIDYDEWNSADHGKEINTDNIPDLSEKQRISMESMTNYKFRLSGINSCGRGSYGQHLLCRTSLEGLPCSPTQFKVSNFVDCVVLSWEPSFNIPVNVLDYSVYLAVKSETSKVNLKRIYRGSQPACTISNNLLLEAYIDYDDNFKPAKIFRVWARNRNGFGLFTQVRFIQGVQRVNKETGNDTRSSEIPPIKRAKYSTLTNESEIFANLNDPSNQQ